MYPVKTVVFLNSFQVNWIFNDKLIKYNKENNLVPYLHYKCEYDSSLKIKLKQALFIVDAWILRTPWAIILSLFYETTNYEVK